MLISLILCAVFLSISLAGYIVILRSSEAWEQYSGELSQSAESKLRKLFLFADARKLLLFYVALVVGAPLALLGSGFGLVSIACVVILIAVAPRMVFRTLAQRRRRLINEALPDALAQIAGAMRAGSTFSTALQATVDEQKGPLSQEFSLLLREQRVGARLEEALDNLAERVQSEEMDLVVSAALIAQDVGGNLAEIFHSLSGTIRRKLEMEGKVRALTAQGRLQGRVVTALPFLILMALLLIEPEATQPIFTSLLGWFFLTVIVVLQLIGSLLIRKIVRISI